jgi:hypothetical protein
MAKREKVLLDKLRTMVARLRRHASGLQSEVDRGIAVRQSIESKESRIEVLTSCADEIDSLIKESVDA